VRHRQSPRSGLLARPLTSPLSPEVLVPNSKRSRGEQAISHSVSDSASVSTRAVVARAHAPDVSDIDVERSLSELAQLLAGLGIDVVRHVVQSRPRPTATYLGEGKLRELAELTGGPGEVRRGPPQPHERARSELLVVVDDELSAGQQRHLERALDARVLDRTAVILRVFEARARTRQARLELELARLEYELPRISDELGIGDREGGGGRAARGHTNVELAKQRARERIAAMRRELEELGHAEARKIAARSEVFRVSLVGYTNAGKSSLMRRLTGAEVLVEDKLFATLGTTVRQLVPAATPPIIAADTVGFIDRLPHALVASFRSTLAEALEAWLLLHVADASDPNVRRQIAITEAALAELGATSPVVLVLSKADRLEPAARAALQAEFPSAIVMSALSDRDTASLRARIDAFFAQHLVEDRFSIPYGRIGLFAEFRDRLCVLEENFADKVEISVRATPTTLAQLETALRAAR
jgi:GTPase